MFSTNTIMIGVFPRWSQFWRRMVVSLGMTCHYLNEDRSTTCYNELTRMSTGFSCQSVGPLSSIFQVKLNSILLPMFSNDFPSTMEIFSQILCWTSIFSIDLFFISFFEFEMLKIFNDWCKIPTNRIIFTKPPRRKHLGWY